MDSKVKIVSDTKFPIVGGDGKPWVEGKKFVDPYFDDADTTLHGKYLVSHYPVPGSAFFDGKAELTPEEEQKVLDTTLRGIKGLMKDFQQRFLHYVDRGYNVTKTSPAKLDDYINQERELLKQPDLPDNEKELTKRWLVTALYGRAMMNAKFHIKLRSEDDMPSEESLSRFHAIAKESVTLELERNITDPAELKEKTTAAIAQLDAFHANPTNEFKNSDTGSTQKGYLLLIEASFKRDLVEAMGMNVALRGKRGYVAPATEEMLGEPRKLFAASLTDTAKERMHHLSSFYEGRYSKVATSMRSVDQTTEAAADVTGFLDGLRKTALRKPGPKTEIADFKSAYDAMAAAAKHKIQVQHGDKDYPAADKSYIAARDELQGMIDKRMNDIIGDKKGASAEEGMNHAQKISATKTAAEVKALNCLKQATDLIYDIAVTREANTPGIEQLKLEISAAGLPTHGHKH